MTRTPCTSFCRSRTCWLASRRRSCSAPAPASCFWSGDSAQIIDELSELATDALPGGPAHLREDPRRGDGPRRRRPRAAARAVQMGAEIRCKVPDRDARGSASRAPRRPAVSARRSPRAVEGPGHLRFEPPAGARRGGTGLPRAARVLRRVRSARARGLRAERELRRGDHQHPSTRSGSALSASHCRGPRCRSRETARY